MNDKQHYIQAIEIGHRVTSTIFDLPCIYSVHKDKNGLCYLLRDWDQQGQYVRARPGDWLCEDESHRWHVLTPDEYRQWQQEQNPTRRDNDHQD